MSDTSPILALPFLQPAQAQKHVTHNEALRRLDVLVQLCVETLDAQTPPDLPAEGEVHALGASPAGAWAGQANALAAWLDGAWHFLPLQEGWRAWSRADAALRLWDGSAWVPPAAGGESLEGLGIGTGWDAGNRLAVKSPATLLTHDGGDHRLKINKGGAAKTASLLFQSGWDGHAEMGLAGSNDFAVKVSADGDGWTEALVLEAASGRAGGAAVQAAPDDAGAGKLLAVGAFGLGETGAAPLLGDLDATDTPAGCYRVTAATLNRPAGPETGLVTIRRHDAEVFLQLLVFDTGDGLQRWHGSGGFGPWMAQYGAGNLLGTVSETGGQPTGAVIERGGNGNGQYTRWADGTQICTKHLNSITASHAWSFPRPFAASTGGKLTVTAMPRHGAAPRIVTEDYSLTRTGVTLKVWDCDGNPAGAQLYVTAFGCWF